MTKSKKSLVSSVLELVVIVATALVLALAIQAFIVKPYRIPSGSMLPTLHINQRVLVNRLGTHFGSPSVGDIVRVPSAQELRPGLRRTPTRDRTTSATTPPGLRRGAVADSTETFIKRVVGLPGDHLSIVGGHVIRNGVPEKDTYIEQCNGTGSCDFPTTIVVPAGDYYMMGDNRGQSDDSRFWGPVRGPWIIGRAFFTYWPPDRVGFL